MSQITRPAPQLPPTDLEHRNSWLSKLREAVQLYLSEHARGIVLLEALVKQTYTVLHDEAAGAVAATTSDWQAVVIEAGKLKRVGAALRTAGAGSCTVEFRVNGTAVASITITAGNTQATTEVISPREVVVGDLLDLNVTAASGTGLAGLFGVA